MRSIATVLFACALAGPLAAQDIDSPYRFVDTRQQVGVLAGMLFTDPGSVPVGPDDGITLGARYGLRITGPFSLEIAALATPSSRMVLDTTVSASGTDTTYRSLGEADMTLAVVHGDLRFDLTGPRTWNRLMPYVLVGVGAAFRASSDDALDEDLPAEDRYRFGTRLVGDLGAGVEWIPLEHWSVRLEAKDYLWKIQVPRGLRRVGTPAEEWVQNYLVSAGVSYRF